MQRAGGAAGFGWAGFGPAADRRVRTGFGRATDGAGSGRSAHERPESARPVSARPASGQSGADRQRQSAPGADMLSDLQRWLIRSGAKSMRKEITGQVRRTFSSGQRSATSNVWDTATTEIPPDAGESPECQWCPICRAARLMRESGPGIGGQLSGAGEVVASAVQDAVSALDSILGKAGGSRVSDSRSGQPRTGQPRTGQPGAGAWQGPGFGDSEPAGPHGAAHDRHRRRAAARICRGRPRARWLEAGRPAGDCPERRARRMGCGNRAR